MGEVVEAKRQEVAARGSGDLLSIIEKVVSAPEVDIDKIDRLLQMQERILAKNAEAEYNRCLSILQSETPAIHKGGTNTHTRKSYARLEDIQAAVKPLMAQQGFAISFRTDTSGEVIRATAILRHSQGHSEETTVELPADKGASRNAVQAVGSSITYAKRYALAALLNIQLDDEDDDGQTATRKHSTNVAGAGAMTRGEEDGEVQDPTEDPLWAELEEDMTATCSTRGEVKDWWRATQAEGGKLYGKRNGHWKKRFRAEVLLPLSENLPEVPF